MATIRLPSADRSIEAYRLGAPRAFARPAGQALNRMALAACHVVADPLADADPWLTPAIDWERTLAYRAYMFELGLGVAEAMDTAQRGMGLDWPTSMELVKRSIALARSIDGAVLFSGAGTDHLAPRPGLDLDLIAAAYEEQIAAIEAAGGRVILMASRALAAAAQGAEDYARVYDRILAQVCEPVILHWLGEMFDPALRGYWGEEDHIAAMNVALDIIGRHADRIDGIKISLLDKEKEIMMRRRLPATVRMYTGDDFNYAELIAGDGERFSDALLGIFDAIAPAAAAALVALAEDDQTSFHEILSPTVPLSRHIFKAPTRFYKTGIVFLAFLNGHQDHFAMVGGQQSARSLVHLAELMRLADRAGLLVDPELAAARMARLLSVYGLG